jgi:hypothetical protein
MVMVSKVCFGLPLYMWMFVSACVCILVMSALSVGLLHEGTHMQLHVLRYYMYCGVKTDDSDIP